MKTAELRGFGRLTGLIALHRALAPVAFFLCLFCLAAASYNGPADVVQKLEKGELRGSTLSTPTLEKEVLINYDPKQNGTVTPWVLAAATDGGYIVAGSARMRGWAAKIDANGRVQWNYYTSLQRSVLRFPNKAIALPNHLYIMELSPCRMGVFSCAGKCLAQSNIVLACLRD
ncbi:MAG: hypothetical protein ABSG25_07205 [Bryobacteraceae bacterium]